MKIQEGPLFGAVIISIGIAYLVYRKTQNILWAILAGIGFAVADFLFLILIQKFNPKK